MGKIIVAILVFFFGIIRVFGQEIDEKMEFKNFSYWCRSDTISIQLPSDFSGPEYHPGEEGAFVSFSARDGSFVINLCAGNTEIELDSNYLEIDSIKTGNRVYSILYYNQVKNLYARELQTKTRFYIYSNATIERKKELDKVFEILQEKENQ